MTRDIGEWLGELGLGKYVEIFAENEIGFSALPHLREDDLKQLGLPMGPRKILLAAIAELDSVKATQPEIVGCDAAAEIRAVTVCALCENRDLSPPLARLRVVGDGEVTCDDVVARA